MADEGIGHRIQQLEGAMSGRRQQDEALCQAWQDLQERLISVEQDVTTQQARRSNMDQLPVAQFPMVTDEAMVGDARIQAVECQLAGLAEKLDNILGEAHGDHGWEARLHEHEVRLSGIRSKLEGAADHHALMNAVGMGTTGVPAPATKLAVTTAEPDSQDLAFTGEDSENVPERLTKLVEQLTQVAPQIIVHTTRLENLASRLQTVETSLAAVENEAKDAKEAQVQPYNSIEQRILAVERRIKVVADSLPQEKLDNLMHIFEETGSSCAILQTQLQEKVTAMDELIQRVSSELPGVSGHEILTSGDALKKQLVGNLAAMDELKRSVQLQTRGGAGSYQTVKVSEKDMEEMHRRIQGIEGECQQIQDRLVKHLDLVDSRLRQILSTAGRSRTDGDVAPCIQLAGPE